MSERLKILLVEDSEPDAELVLRELRHATLEHESRRVDTQADFERELKAFRPDVILSDFSMPRFNGMEALAICRQLNIDVPFIFVSATIGEDAAIKAMKAGAHDYVMKGNLARLVPAVQRELREARARQARTIAEAGLHRAQVLAKLAHVITAPDGTFESWSETLPQLTGAERDKVPASTREWLDLLHPDDRAAFRARSIEARTRHERQDVDYRLRHSDGAWIHVRQTMEPLSESAGESRWFNTLQDVTEQVRAESDLRASEAKFRTLIEQAADGIFVTDSRGQFLLANSRYCEMLGYSEEELFRMNVADTFPPAERAEALQRIPQLQEVKYRLYERRMYRKAGSSFPAEISVRAVGDGTHQGIARDVTARKAAEEKIKRLNRVHAVLGQINAVIVRVQEREELFREATRIAIEHGKFRMAWIGVVDQEAGLVKPVASAGDVRDFFESAPLAVIENQPGGHGLAGRAVRDLKPVISNDVRSDPQRLMRKELTERGINSLAIVPLIVGGEAIGVLALYAADVGFFDDEEMKLLQELAGDISFAFDHIEKEEKVRRLTRVHAVLTGINAAIVRIRDREALFRESCRIAVEAGELRLAWIGIVDPRKEEIVPVVFSGAEDGLLGVIRLSTREDGGRLGLSGRAVRERAPAIFNDVLTDERAQLRGESARRGFRSVAMIPLIVEGAAIGVLGLHAVEPGFFDQDEMKLLMEVVGNIAFALEHIDKEEKVQRLTRVYAVLSGINALIVRASDREELFREACRIAVEAGRFPKAWIGTLEPESQAVRLAAGHGADALFFERLAAKLKEDEPQGHGVVASAVRQRQPVISNDLAHDPRVLGRENAAATGSRSLVVLPLMVADDVAGVLVLHADVPGFFDDEEMKLLLELAGDISFALDHIEKEERVRRLTRVHAVLTGINTAIVRIRDREALFRESCRIAVGAGQMRMAWIGIIDPRRGEVVPAAFSGAEQGLLKIIQLSTREDSGRFGMAGRAIRDRTPSVSHDLLADKRIRYSKEQEERGFRSLAMVPLIVNGVAIGVLGLHVADAGFFNPDEMKLLMEVAGNIAFALEHIDKEEKVQRLTRVYAVLSGINALIVRVSDRAELFREACRIAVQSGQFALAWVAVADQRDHRVKAVAWAGDERGYMQLTRPTADAKEQGKTGLGAQAIDNLKPAICNDIEADGASAMRYPKEALERGYRSAVALPLVIEGKAIGALVLYAAEVDFFDDEEMKLLVDLAGDISFALDHLEKAERINYLAYYDELTGLANRTLFRERVEQHILAAVNAQRSFALVVVNVDRFKAINDAFGRQAGDELLKQIAGRFVIAPRDANRLARIGADHFAYVGTTAQSEEEVARHTDSRLQRWFGSPYRVGANELHVSVTAGIAVFPSDGGDADELLKNAEAALKKAKAGGERYLFFEQQMTERIAENLSLENKLRQALEKEQFVLHYQPKVDLETRAVVGVEALIRWQSPDKGLVPPLHFIPLLEETGLILQVGEWALKRAARDHRGWVEQKLKAPRVAVNVSAIQLRQRDFVRVVEEAIIDGVAPTAIDLEITESLVMEDIKGNIEKLKAVRALGVQIAIDDFGTGYSSLGYLAQLPVQALKIDRSFIIKMGEDPNAMTLVSTIISLAHSLRLKVVAEGVETEDQAKFLRLLRCDEMQGYLFSKPVPAEQLVALLKAG